MSLFAVTYVYAPDSARLDEFRPEHRARLGALNAAGSLVASGPLPATGEAPGGALLLVEADDAAGAAQLLDDDPFRREGLIAERVIREWIPVIGSLSR